MKLDSIGVLTGAIQFLPFLGFADTWTVAMQDALQIDQQIELLLIEPHRKQIQFLRGDADDEAFLVSDWHLLIVLLRQFDRIGFDENNGSIVQRLVDTDLKIRVHRVNDRSVGLPHSNARLFGLASSIQSGQS